MDTTLTIFPDTNIFLQCRPLQDLPWSELGSYTEYHFVIAPTVLQELDKHSHDGNARRSKRAKAAITLVDKVLKCPAHIYVLREGAQKLTVSLGDHPPEGAVWPYPLDKEVADHRILFEFITFTKASPEYPTVYLTIDRAASALAMKLGVNFKQAPSEWLLPPEPNEDDKRITALETEIKSLKANQPVIELALPDQDGEPIKDEEGDAVDLVKWSPKNSICINLQTYPDLTSSQIDEIVALAQSMYPMVTDFGKEPPSAEDLPYMRFHRALTSSQEWRPASEEAIAEYRDKAYPKWVADVKAWAQGITEALNNSANIYYLRVAMSNTGGVPARTTILEFETVPVALVIAAPGKTSTAKGPPAHPAAPMGRYVQWADRIMGLRGYPIATSEWMRPVLPNLDFKKHDPHVFYFHPKKPISAQNKRAYICDNFRHKVESVKFDLLMTVVPKDPRPDNGALRVQVTADNLPIPVNVTIPIQITYETLDTLQKVKELLHMPDSSANREEKESE